MTGVTLLLLVSGVIGFMATAAWLLERVPENPYLVGDARRAYEQRVALLAVAIGVVLFVVVATFPQGRPS